MGPILRVCVCVLLCACTRRSAGATNQTLPPPPPLSVRPGAVLSRVRYQQDTFTCSMRAYEFTQSGPCYGNPYTSSTDDRWFSTGCSSMDWIILSSGCGVEISAGSYGTGWKKTFYSSYNLVRAGTRARGRAATAADWAGRLAAKGTSGARAPCPHAHAGINFQVAEWARAPTASTLAVATSDCQRGSWGTC